MAPNIEAVTITGAAPQSFGLSRGGRPTGRLEIPCGDFNLRTQLLATLQAMREEAVREARRAEADGLQGAKLAWLYTQIGAYEFAQQLGLLTNIERQTLTDSLRREVN